MVDGKTPGVLKGAWLKGAGLALALGIAWQGSATAATPVCETKQAIRFAGLNWDSNAFLVSVARFVLKHGYGCRSRSIPGATLLLLNGLGRGDVHVYMQLYEGNAPVAWNKISSTGRAKALSNTIIPDATEGWYVPRFVVAGDAKRNIKSVAPDLKAVSDLPKYAMLFRDPVEPKKGRFYNCMLGWLCESTNSKKLQAYGLDKYYTNFRPGSGVALTAAIISAYRRGKPILAYNWTPSLLLAKYDMVKLEEPPFNKALWAKLLAAKSGKGLKATAYPNVRIVVAVNSKFASAAPKAVAFLGKIRTPIKVVNTAIVYMDKHKDPDGERAALRFLKTEKALWRTWVPADVASRVEAALN